MSKISDYKYTRCPDREKHESRGQCFEATIIPFPQFVLTVKFQSVTELLSCVWPGIFSLKKA